MVILKGGVVKRELKMMMSQIVEFNDYRISPDSAACLRPCHEVRAISKLKNWARPRISATQMGINLNFRKNMKVTTHHKACSLFDLIVDIGSSLGLWIGLSALGVFDLFIQAGDIINAFRPGTTKKGIK